MNNKNYDDIIHLPNPTSKNHPRMSLYERAAQFSPFAALTGHDDAIRETARLTDEKKELDEDTLTQLNEKLRVIRENIGSNEAVSITYFVPDERKSGGEYVTHFGTVRRIDEYEHTIIMNDKTQIPIEQICGLETMCQKQDGNAEIDVT